MYTTIVRHIITYASVLWWPTVDKKLSQICLISFQRLACLGMTRAMCTCPTAAMEALLDLLPLHFQVKSEAFKSAIRLNRSGYLKPIRQKGHLKILDEYQGSYLISIVSDIMLQEMCFDNRFNVVIETRDVSNTTNPSFDRGALVWYTDGSKTKEGTGMGIVGPNTRGYEALGKVTTVFQAELLAILNCAYRNLKKRTKRYEHFYPIR